MTQISSSMFESLQAALRGSLLLPGESGYDTARALHNGMIDRRPAAIVRCAGVSDIKRAIDFGRRHSLPLSVRGGAHGVPGFAVCDGGLMVDVSPMTSVTVDPHRRIATVEGGANWGQFDHETQAFGLATTGGLVRTTGVAGLTLSGGHGFLMRKHGLACDNLRSATVLTASGELVTATATRHADLLWALRGGGGNFGVVTSLEFQLHELGPVLGGLLMFPFTAAREVLAFYDEFTASAPDELGVLAAIGTLPDGTKAIVHPTCYAGDIARGEDLLRPLRTFTAPLADQLQPLPYTAVQSIVENFNPPGRRNYWKMVYLNELPSDAIAVMTDMYARVPAPLTHIVIYTLGGAVNRVGTDSAAVGRRDARHAAIAIGMWDRPEEDEVNITWVREFYARMQPFSSGGFYPNYEGDATTDRLASAFGSAAYARLGTIKARYDPDNVFCMNQNVVPTP
jgi:FAD/FMN-containing dehydrogenase